jgi:signal transduction histidine kinase
LRASCRKKPGDLLTGEGVRVAVADTGTGMSETTLEHIFEPFFTTKGIQGSGLGLWLSAETLIRHRATVKIRSRQTVGRTGTVFHIFFPMDGANGAPDSLSDPRHAG